MAQQQIRNGQMANAPYEFSAPPRLINRAGPMAAQPQFRDPYREFIKIAPQNIMYDRRVVRGNTFAALVIPVSMQTDPVSLENQNQRESGQKRRTNYGENQGNSGLKPGSYGQRSNRQSNAEEQYQRQQDWENLSDVSRQIDEHDIEPDYYIDLPPRPTFIPDIDGIEKHTESDKNTIYDFNMEAEPILQALVGRALEQGLIEVKEDFENLELANHKKKFKQLRESELMETQRLEANSNRKNEEVEARNLQVRTTGLIQEETEKKIMSRMYAKSFLRGFKKENFQVLLDFGVVRSQFELNMGATLLPKLIGQAEYNETLERTGQNDLNELVLTSSSRVAAQHKNSIAKEIKRRKDVEIAKIKKAKDDATAKAKRKERRNALREAYRLANVGEIIKSNIIATAQKIEYNPSVRVHDVREYLPEGPNGIFVLGGFVSELIMCFSALYDLIHAVPATAEFRFTADGFERFLQEITAGDFGEGNCVLKLTKDIRSQFAFYGDDHAKAAEDAADLLKDPSCHQGFGMNFIISHFRDFNLNETAISEIFQAILRSGMHELKAEKQLPEEGSENYEAVRDSVNAENEKIRQTNDAISKNQAKIGLKHVSHFEGAEDGESPADPNNWAFWNEKCFLSIGNYRGDDGMAQPIDEGKPMDKRAQLAAQKLAEEKAKLASLSPQLEEGEQPFEIERIPAKMQIVPAINKLLDVNMMICHNEAPHFIRKWILEKARGFWPKETKDLFLTNSLLGIIDKKFKLIEEKFEQNIIVKKLNFGKGQMVDEKNYKIIFNTFLKENDTLVNQELLQTLLKKPALV